MLSICFNPIVSLPDANFTQEALEKLEFLGVIDFFMSETAHYADVVLAGSLQEEEEGVTCNVEGLVIHIRQAVTPPGNAHPDSQIICDLARELGRGHFFNFRSPREIFSELREASRGDAADYYGITYEKIDRQMGVFWPCPSEDHPGTPRLFEGGRTFHPDGKAHFQVTEYRESGDPVNDEYPIYLTTGRVVSAVYLREVTVYNDIHAALYGELKLGAARGCRDVLGVFIGTGIGGTIVSNGKMHSGASGQAGNIGHYLLQPYGPLAGSERHGVLDEVASRVAIAGAAASFAVKEWAPHLRDDAGTDVRKIKSSDLAAAIGAGDKSVEEQVRSRAQIVGIVLSNMVDFLNPEMVVLGGGLTDAMPKLIREAVTAGISAHATAQARQGLRVVTAKLKGHAVTTGAAKLASEAAR